MSINNYQLITELAKENEKKKNLQSINSHLKQFTGLYRDNFTGKSVKLFYRFTGKFSVKAQPYTSPDAY